MPLDRVDTALRYSVANAGEDLLRLYFDNLDTHRDVTNELQWYALAVIIIPGAQWLYHAGSKSRCCKFKASVGG